MDGAGGDSAEGARIGGPDDVQLSRLYRKRAIDRENQRVWRHKNKTKLAALEAQVKTLKESLQKAEDANSLLRARVDRFHRAFDPLVPALQAAQSLLPRGDAAPGDLGTNHAPIPVGLGAGHDFPTLPLDTLSSGDVSGRNTQFPAGVDGGEAFNYWDGGGLLTFTFDTSDNFNSHDFSLDVNVLLHGPTTGPLEIYDTVQSPTMLDNSNILPDHSLSHIFHEARVKANEARDKKPIWQNLPLHVPPTTPIDQMVADIIAARTSQNSSNRVDDAEFSQSGFPSVSSLLNHALEEPDKPIASTIARHIARAVIVPTFPEKVAMLYKMCLLVRWFVCSTEENYDAIPMCWRPTGAQLTVPHPIWVDMVSWPTAREYIIRYMDFTTYRDLAGIITQSSTINWKRPMRDILDGSSEKGFVLTPAFIDHVRDLSNWSVRSDVVGAFPFLEGNITVRER